jgi:hypothetical protein
MLTADGFDDAILGIADRGPGNPVIAYDFNKCVQILIDREYMDFNVTGAWLGDQTPIFVHLGQPFACN